MLNKTKTKYMEENIFKLYSINCNNKLLIIIIRIFLMQIHFKE